MDTNTLLLLALGVSLQLWKNKRIHDRQNRFGVNEYRSFSARLAAGLLDALLAMVGLGCVGLAVAIHIFEHAPGFGTLAVIVAFLMLVEADHYRHK